jgi:hypothetical protein
MWRSASVPGPRVPEAVREEMDWLKALWQASTVSCQGHLGLWDHHAQPDRYQARLRVIQSYYEE